MLAAIVESSEDAILSKDLNGTITSWNPAAQRLFGYSRNEIIGQPVTRIVPPELHAEEAAILERLRRGDSLAHFETVRIAKDGRYIPVSLSVSPVRDGTGAIIGASKILRDITGRKQAEAEMSRQNEEARVQSQELARQNEELQQASEELERQTEELQAQADELQATNLELNRRESMLQTILASLRGASGEGQMLSRICQALVELAGEAVASAAVVEQQGEQLVVRVHAGPEKLRQDRWPFARSFASLVMDQGRTAFVDDLAARPELVVPEPAGRKFRSLLVTPLRVNGRPVGAVEVYSLVPRQWTRQQFAIIEWAAAQCGMALEAVRLQQELRDSRAAAQARAEELAVIMDVMPAITFIAHDREGRRMSSSRAACELLRVPYGSNTSMTAPPGEQPAGLRALSDGRKLNPEELPVQRAAATGQAVRNCELRLVFEDGTSRDIFGNVMPLLDAGGRPRGAVGAFIDLTQRKRVEEALRLSEQKFALAFANNPAAIAITALEDGRFIEVNDTWVELTGYSRNEVIGRSARLLPIWPTPEAAARFVNELRAQGSLRGWEQEFRKKSGESYVAQLSAAVLTVQGEKVVLSTLVDISERKRAEEALRQSEEQFRTLADSMPNLAWWANGDGYITWYNRRWYEYTGATPEQMEGWGWQSVHDPALLPKVLERWQASIATGEPFEMEFPLRGADGRFRWFLTRVMPVRDAAGKVLRWFGTNTDVSETRDAREVLARSKEELERLVAERTAKLQELVGELEHFSYTITHDMRAPLRAMRGFAEVVNELCADCPHQEQKELLRRISVSSDRMDALIRDALNYNRAVRQELPLEPVDTGALLRGMLDSYPELQPSRAHIKVEGALPLVMGNEAGLTQCFSNLLGNAVKFAKPGQTPEIRVWAEQRDGRARIWIEDDGIGIPQRMLPRVFDMFSRGHSTHEGTGIGLALVRKVTDRMGGKVGVESQEQKGSRFWLELKPVP